MAQEFRNTDEFRSALFWHADISGSVFRACDVNDVRIVGSDITNLRVEGHAGRAGTVIVDGVDVTEFVDAELERRHPELVQLREMTTADDARALWAMVQNLWDETVSRAKALPEEQLNERVDDEWSFIETIRHLIYATDVWIGRMADGIELPFDRISLPNTGYPPEDARALGIDLDAHPTLDEALDVHAERRMRMTQHLETLTVGALEETRTRAPTPRQAEMTVTVRDCVFTVIEEHIQHRRYAVRDLGILESR